MLQSQNDKKLAVLGTRGIPAGYGGFETFAEYLALYLVSNDWEVTVYCQEEGSGDIYEDKWKNVRLVHIPVTQEGALGTIIFDWKSILHASHEKSLKLTLGYNTAIFCALYNLKGIPNLINMDGLEWRREKWNFFEKAWLYVNERFACRLAHHLIADHPEIKQNLSRQLSDDKITTIPYGAEAIRVADSRLLNQYGLESKGYCLVIARSVPENSILEIVSAFSEKRRGLMLTVLGEYMPNDNPFHQKIFDAASDEVLFLGTIYDKLVVAALRYHCRLHIHGHRVGGTNPSLVEALGAGSPVLAHDNTFNRWVAGKHAAYFKNAVECASQLDRLLADEAALEAIGEAGRKRHAEVFAWGKILSAYESLLVKWLPCHDAG